MERRLTKSLEDKIASLDISKPYVWQLRLSETDFKELEVCLWAISSADGVSALARRENALITIVYMAEWYKRRYRGGNKSELVANLDLETLWTNAGINKKLYLYKDDSSNKRWLYSIYVLGGLAIKHELSRNDNMKFLKGLCRIYHGESYTLENLDRLDISIKAAYNVGNVIPTPLFQLLPFSVSAVGVFIREFICLFGIADIVEMDTIYVIL